jgi:hypothetical protein
VAVAKAVVWLLAGILALNAIALGALAVAVAIEARRRHREFRRLEWLRHIDADRPRGERIVVPFARAKAAPRASRGSSSAARAETAGCTATSIRFKGLDGDIGQRRCPAFALGRFGAAGSAFALGRFGAAGSAFAAGYFPAPAGGPQRTARNCRTLPLATISPSARSRAAFMVSFPP